MKKIFAYAMVAIAASSSFAYNYTDYVDPKIGSVGLGRVYVGPCMPYGMAKPSPDGVSMPNSGWAPLTEDIKGFSQVHVSGTGGGQKYGNILVMPFVGTVTTPWSVSEARNEEEISLGYYATHLQSGISVEITSANRACIYRFSYPEGTQPGLIVDAGAFLGMSPIPDQRETQQLVGSQIEVVSDTEIKGYNRVRGGWNDGRAYTVYFYAVSSTPFTNIETWKGETISTQHWQSDTHQYTGAVVKFPDNTQSVSLKIGISFISELKAKENLVAEIPGFDFDGVYASNLDAWEDLLKRIEIAPSATEQQKRMFYTGLYHTMIMPTDRSGENPLWSDDNSYYDDYYAIWDTYRTSTPMITLIDPEREVDIVNSLLNIYKRDGYLPDARSGNANGRTQGGSNAEIVLADAFVKGLEGIDYELALEAMLKDADVAPGGIEEAEGRGGLAQYNTLGYVPFGIPRAGNRTVEYAYDDYAIAQVANGLGRDDLYQRFMGQSQNWKNLWRDDYEHAGVKGFIMPRDPNGQWLDSLPQGHSEVYQPKYPYTAMTFEGPWYTKWWSMFFYEAPSWEYSLSIPHDVPGLIEICGGPEAFEHRLDTFFVKGFYNVNNEPSFLSPCLYHWIGKPWKSSERVHQIIRDNYNDSPIGLPGNDDSGAMSSWLDFHMLGLYPNAGQDYYLINTPMIEGATIHLADGNDFTIQTRNFNPKNSNKGNSKNNKDKNNKDKNHSKGNSKELSKNNNKPQYIVSAELNGEPYPYSSISHSDIVKGGTLTLTLGDKPGEWGRELAPATPLPQLRKGLAVIDLDLFADADLAPANTDLLFVFKLHGQTRRYKMSFSPEADGSIQLTWGIERNLKWQEGTFIMTPQALENGTLLDMRMPIDGENITLPSDMTAYMISRGSFKELKTTGSMTCNKANFKVVNSIDPGNGLIHVRDDYEGCEMWILDNADYPIIWAMQRNPLEVEWTVKKIQ